jgi:hypothetical protein
MQYYRLFDCALTAMSRGQLDQTMLQRSAGRLEARLLSYQAKLSTNATDGSGQYPIAHWWGRTPPG